MTAVGVLGVGLALPPTIRTNDWWPTDEVARWHERMALRATERSDAPAPAPAPAVAATLAAMGRYADDPFRGIRSRRVMAPGTTVNDLEVEAARAALAQGGVALDEVDAILGTSFCPEDLCVNHTCITHARLGLPQRCLVLASETACNGFALHLTLAQGLIASGAARRVLTVHSCGPTRMLGHSEPHSAWFGDGAGAAVLGPVPAGHGILATSHHADGGLHDALVVGRPDARWWEDGALGLYSPNRDSTRAMMLRMVEKATASLADALARAELAPADVDFYACHQSTAWLAEVTCAQAGMVNARTIVTFPELGHLSSANLPVILARGRAAGQFGPGSIVATFSGGIGETWSASVHRWAT